LTAEGSLKDVFILFKLHPVTNATHGQRQYQMEIICKACSFEVQQTSQSSLFEVQKDI